MSWPLLGAAWGAWLGFGGHLRLAHNADGFGSLIALGFFAVFALLGLVAGAAAGALIGGTVDAVLRRLGVGLAAALCVATLVNALAIWQIASAVQAIYPGLRADGPAKVRQEGRRGVAPSMPPITGPASGMSCADPPPTQPAERAVWDAECR